MNFLNAALGGRSPYLFIPSRATMKAGESAMHVLHWIRRPIECVVNTMARRLAEIDFAAPLRWLPRVEYAAYFDSLPAEDRWTNSKYPNQAMIWHWDERRWWVLEEES